MTAEEMQAELRRLRWAEPFVPFTIELTNGQIIEADIGEGIGFNGGFGWFHVGGIGPIKFRHDQIARIVVPAPPATA